MCTLQGKRNLSRRTVRAVFPVEFHPVGNQVTHPRRTLAAQYCNRFRITQPGTGIKGVTRVGICRVGRRNRSGNPALRPPGVRLLEPTLRHHRHARAMGNSPCCREKAGYPAPNHQQVNPWCEGLMTLADRHR